MDALSNIRTIAIFDEAKGSVDFARWRREITQVASNVGQDFKVALLTISVWSLKLRSWSPSECVN